MNNSFRDWIGGLISAVAGAFSTCTTTALVAPDEINLVTSSGRQRMMFVALAAAAPAIWAYLQRRPLPGVVEEVQKTSLSVHTDSSGMTTTTVGTQKTTVTEAPKPDA